MSGLNPQQAAAVAYRSGPLLVLAGAGSGKTKVITEKIVRLVREDHLAPNKIAAITFTNKAAREMRERVGKLMKSEQAQELTVCTFHSMGLKFLQIEHEAAGLRRGFSIFDSDDSTSLLKELLPKGAKPDVVDGVRGLISRAKNDVLSPEQAMAAARSPREREAAEIYAEYQRRLGAFNALDFDDLIRLPVALLAGSEDLQRTWRERLRYLLVDEYQDSNPAQYAMVKLLAGPRGMFTCVGDDDQSIYAWRGANPENLNQLSVDYPNLRLIKLEQNYRCAKRILRAANALIANNPHEHLKALWSEHREGEPIRVFECRDDEHEAERVASEISHLAEKHRAPWSDFAVLFRGNHQSRPLEKALQLLRIPYHLAGGTAFLDRGEVKDTLAWLRLVANPDDDAAFLRAVTSPKREIGSTTLAKLGELAGQRHESLLKAAERNDVLKVLPARPAAALDGFVQLIRRFRQLSNALPAADLCRKLIEDSGLLAEVRATSRDDSLFQRRRGNLEELAGWLEAARGGGGPGELAAQLALLSHADRDDPGESVRLMSLHGSKGLEFRYVFIVGVHEGSLPHDASLDEGKVEEERRLMYVGITRAKELLHLSYPKRAKRFGEVSKNEPSRFLSEIPAAELHWVGRDAEKDAERREDVAAASLAKLAALFND
ncbi:UvrD-helicase domain-containing protein [uncultured Aquimonas sp.]|uniref:UvrD-helicase domain-containing protein n=1 Tax=uncultured Aquimonas sp. TaxID=385483 RepID=UPI0008683E97|nr:UvrD-helicase domain-containing protein [uncultured Aquimonas sp.]ODU48434.1 MAG: ATP-dependent DNA helicase Rep [Xanthomonadaceae bacterium SCN 69-123]